jgi:acid phosphatase (class A)
MHKLALWSLALVCLTVGPALALSDKPYLVESDADFANVLPPPPLAGSERERLDLRAVVLLQRGLNPELMQQIQADTALSVFQVAGVVLGPNFTKEKLASVGAFFDKVNKDSAVGVRAIKQKYARKRPFQVSQEVKTPENIAAASQGPTYPSGHGTFGAECAILLSMMVPEHREQLYARGWDYGAHRLLSGVAYPSDLETARIGAVLMVTLMLQKPEFRADFDAVKADLRKGLGLTP